MKKILLLLLSVFVFSCENESIEEESKVPEKYIKSIVSSSGIIYRAFEYSDNLLTNVYRNDEYYNKYFYDDSNNLIKEEDAFADKEIFYTYDSSNRIVKKEEIGASTSKYTELTYEEDKIIFKHYYEDSVYGEINRVQEYYIDSKGRVIEIRQISYLIGDIDRSRNGYAKYEYDENGNVIKIISKLDENYPEVITELEYDDKVNPYNFAYDCFNVSLAYLSFYSSVPPTYNAEVPSLNNIINDGFHTIEYEYDEDNYPIKYSKYDPDGNLDDEGCYEYYK